MAQARGQFSSKLGFILAAAGSAVGLGNLVAFPVMALWGGAPSGIQWARLIPSPAVLLSGGLRGCWRSLRRL